jgi:AcrR family transcriptional regulator
VIQKAHQLFIEKGYHATSIQDILDLSGISKGSFYNYFSSKAELFKAVLTSIENELKEKRDALLIGKDPSDVDVFIQQVVLSLETNKKNKLLQLVEDALVSNEPELIAFIKQSRFVFIKWVYHRFLDLFAEDQEPYLFDCAVMFSGMLQHFLQINHETRDKQALETIVDYAMRCTITLVEEVSRHGIQLFPPDHIPFLVSNTHRHHFFNHQISMAALNLRKTIERQVTKDDPKQGDYLKLLHFIQEELMKNEPRRFLIDSALLSLEQCAQIRETREFEAFRQIIPTMLES